MPIILHSQPPLVAVVPALTAVYEHRQNLVKLKWQHQDRDIMAYELQSSMNNNTWFPFQVIKTRALSTNELITVTNRKVEAGRNYFRLKTIRTNGESRYGPSIIVIIGHPGHSWILYPVPVRDLLNLQYNGNELIGGVISVFIQHINGRVFHKLRFASSTRHMQIPVDNLGTGIYDVRIVINNEVVWNQRFVK